MKGSTSRDYIVTLSGAGLAPLPPVEACAASPHPQFSFRTIAHNIDLGAVRSFARRIASAEHQRAPGWARLTGLTRPDSR